MTWTAYKVTFELQSPLHVGWRKSGNLQQTRPYLTGRNLWGAITARLTRDPCSNHDSRDYDGMGKQVDRFLAFSYFYPSTAPEKVCLWSWEDNDKFSWEFMSSYASTALSDGRSKEDASLHETEFIAPRSRTEGKQVYLLGYIFEKNNCKLNWCAAITRLQFGGERNYGWGRTRLISCKEDTTGTFFERYSLDCNDTQPIITATGSDTPLLAHTIADSIHQIQQGVIEPLVGLTTTSDGKFGKTPSEVEICWTPGSTAKAKTAFLVKEKGLWYPV